LYFSGAAAIAKRMSELKRIRAADESIKRHGEQVGFPPEFPSDVIPTEFMTTSFVFLRKKRSFRGIPSSAERLFLTEKQIGTEFNKIMHF